MAASRKGKDGNRGKGKASKPHSLPPTEVEARKAARVRGGKGVSDFNFTHKYDKSSPVLG